LILQPVWIALFSSYANIQKCNEALKEANNLTVLGVEWVAKGCLDLITAKGG